MSNKTPEMREFCNNLAKNLFGHDAKEGECVVCGEKATEFRDELSRQEYGISQMCQKCQDKIFK